MHYEYENSYRCPDCGYEWTDEAYDPDDWGDCPKCDRRCIDAHKSEEITRILRITIHMRNAAFAGNAFVEVQRILMEALQNGKIEQVCITEDAISLRDVNGNTCGLIEVGD